MSGVTIDLSSGNDFQSGTAFDDSIRGLAGNDTILGDAGNDTLIGGAGTDWASYANAGGSVEVNLGANSSAGADGNDSLIEIENVLGGNFDDSIVGDSLANVLDGGLGFDILEGGSGDDTLVAGGGADQDIHLGHTGNE